MKPFELWEANPFPIRLTWDDASSASAGEAPTSEGDEGEAQVRSDG